MVHLITIVALIPFAMGAFTPVINQVTNGNSFLQNFHLNTIQEFLEQFSRILNVRRTLEEQSYELAIVTLPNVLKTINESLNNSIANTNDKNIKSELEFLRIAINDQEIVLNNLTRHYGIGNTSWRRPRQYSNNAKSLRGGYYSQGYGYEHGNSQDYCLHNVNVMQIIGIIQQWVRTGISCTRGVLNTIFSAISQGAIILGVLTENVDGILILINNCITDPNFNECILTFGPELIGEIENSLIFLTEQLEMIANGAVQTVENCILNVVSSVGASIIC